MKLIASMKTLHQYIKIALVLVTIILTACSVRSQSSNKYSGYLFTYFTGNAKADESIHFAISTDGYTFRALNNNKPVISSTEISSTGGVRDPHILRGEDGKTFYMVVTDMVSGNGWNSNRAMVLLKSNDLINWKSSVVNIQQRFKEQDSLLRVWAPQTIYDSKKGKYMIYFSMKHGMKDPDKIYYVYANSGFTDLEAEPMQLFYSPTNGASIDGDIIQKDEKFYLFFKTEGEGAGIKIAVSDKMNEGYQLRDKYVQQTREPVEGAGVFKLNQGKDYILMYDMYTTGKYQFTRSADFNEFTVVDKNISMNFHPRHGTVIPITRIEMERLIDKWGHTEDLISAAMNPSIRRINIKIDTIGKTIELPVNPEASLKNFDPQFVQFPGMLMKPGGKQDFSKGPVNYTVTLKGKQPENWAVTVKDHHNPVLTGMYADPDIIYSNKTGRFYIYPTTDGYNNWSGTHFKSFSSSDLINWKDEGVILDLYKDVSWAKRNAWAPCVIEKKTGSSYKYYYYFTAAQKIGVAVADDPAGPFADSGKPLIDKYPPGITKGQQIDPDVFEDPQTGKSYLYWGNSYMAVAELNEDMVSIKSETIKVITPDSSFREGTAVFFRNGQYYFLWSEDDTRSENYKVRYGTSNSPVGPIQIPANNLVIAKDTVNGIYATGHNSVIQIPGKDEWYIVYHRFNYPNGRAMGRAAGYNREVCIDKLEFNADGSIRRTIPTHRGIERIR